MIRSALSVRFGLNTARFFAILGFLLFFSAGAYADVELTMADGKIWTLYAFGNAQALADALRAVDQFTISGVFQSLVTLIAISGSIFLALKEGTSPSIGRKFVTYSVSLLLFTYFFFGWGGQGRITILLSIEDTVDSTWIAPITVPAAIGVPASVISTIGQQITAAIESKFAIPDALKMSKGAPFNLTASLLADVGQARFTDSNFNNSLAYYMQDCFVLGVANGELQASTILSSKSFLADIKLKTRTDGSSTGDALFVITYLGEPLAAGADPKDLLSLGESSLVTCNEAWTKLNDFVTKTGSADLLLNASAWSRTPATSVLTASMDAVASHLSSNLVTDGGSIIKQTALLNTYKGTQSSLAAATGNSEFLTSIGLAQAKEAQYNSWVTGAEVFNRVMGYVLSLLQVFVYAIMPLVLMASLIPGLGGKLFVNFAQILLWLAIVPPMLAIVNYVILSMQFADLGGLLAIGGGSDDTLGVPLASTGVLTEKTANLAIGGGSDDTLGVSLASMGVLTEKTANMRAAGSFIGTMVPALAWALVKGAMDFSKIIGTAAGEQFSNNAATTSTTGNYSLNSGSIDSFTANKRSIAATGDFGGYTSTGGVVGQGFDLGGSTNPNQKSGENISSARGVAATNGIASASGTSVAGVGSAGTSNNLTTQVAAAQTDSTQRGTAIANAVTTAISAQAGISAAVGGKGGSSSSPPSTLGLGADTDASLAKASAAELAVKTGKDANGKALTPAEIKEQGAIYGDESAKVNAAVTAADKSAQDKFMAANPTRTFATGAEKPGLISKSANVGVNGNTSATGSRTNTKNEALADSLTKTATMANAISNSVTLTTQSTQSLTATRSNTANTGLNSNIGERSEQSSIIASIRNRDAVQAATGNNRFFANTGASSYNDAANILTAITNDTAKAAAKQENAVSSTIKKSGTLVDKAAEETRNNAQNTLRAVKAQMAETHEDISKSNSFTEAGKATSDLVGSMLKQGGKGVDAAAEFLGVPPEFVQKIADSPENAMKYLKGEFVDTAEPIKGGVPPKVGSNEMILDQMGRLANEDFSKAKWDKIGSNAAKEGLASTNPSLNLGVPSVPTTTAGTNANAAAAGTGTAAANAANTPFLKP